MLFNSYNFIFLFLPIVFFVYFYLSHKKWTTASKTYLVISSLFFYSWWNVLYLPLIIGSMLVNYMVGTRLSKHKMAANYSKKMLLTIGVGANVLLLAYFKYTDFFIVNLNSIADWSIDLFNLTLPLAISFFTFQQIAYLVDSYRNEGQEYHVLNYALFVTFFPQLIAGPIVHHQEMMPQFLKTKNKLISYSNIALGLFIFSIGLFKKVVIADTFSIWATAGFDNAQTLSLLEAWATSLSYTFQLYFDFSGYTDMATGIALLFNIKLPINFNSPYKALNIQEFWRRWHITLSRFLRDYIYIPLGGSRKGQLKTFINLMATFILGGLWHGAGWTFIFWGLLHGIAVIVYRLWSRIGIKLPNWMSLCITFNFINLSWVFFRAKEWKDAIKVLGGMIDFNAVVFTPDFIYIYERTFKKLAFIMPNLTATIQQAFIFDFKTYWWILVAFILVTKFQNSYEIISYNQSSQVPVLRKVHSVYFAILFMFSILYMSLSTHTEFIYFNF